MSYLVLNRIQAQLEASKRVEKNKQNEKLNKDLNKKLNDSEESKKNLDNLTKESVGNAIDAQEDKPIPIQPVDLRKILLNELNKEDEIKQSQEITFSGIEHFVAWYLPNKDKFTQAQQVPLMTLIQVRDSISVGCGCKMAARIKQANEYFQSFWTKNALTDLPAKVLEVGNFKKIAFSVPLSDNFLVYPQQS